jgi:hypothetical protein
VKNDLNKTNGVTGHVAEIDESQIALMAQNQLLRQELELLRSKSERDQIIYAYWIVGLTVGIAVMGGLLYQNTKRKRVS